MPDRTYPQAECPVCGGSGTCWNGGVDGLDVWQEPCDHTSWVPDPDEVPTAVYERAAEKYGSTSEQP